MTATSSPSRRAVSSPCAGSSPFTHTRADVEHGAELRAVDRSRRRHQLADRGRFERVVGATRRVARLGEQPQPDAQIAISATPSLMTASPAGLVLSNA